MIFCSGHHLLFGGLVNGLTGHSNALHTNRQRMCVMKIVACIIVAVALLGLLVYTNPSLDDYNNFIRQSIIKEGQKQKDDPVGQLLVPLFSGMAGNLVASQTVRSDYVFFSVYSFRFGKERLKALGVLKNFIFLEKPAMYRHQTGESVTK